MEKIITKNDLSSVNFNVLPENFDYKDTGCRYSKNCLSCTLSICIYDYPGWYSRHLKNSRDKKIITDRLNGISIKEISEKYQISIRTVHRAVKNKNDFEIDIDLFKTEKQIYKKPAKYRYRKEIL